MKKSIYTILASVILTACLVEPKPEDSLIEELRTEKETLLIRSFDESRTEPVDYSFLGYGFDVRGEFAGISSVKSKIFDLEKLAEENSALIDIVETNQQAGKIDITAVNRNEFLMGLSDNFESTRGLSVFSGTIDAYFPDSLISEDNVFASWTLTRLFKNISIDLEGSEFLTQEFTNDLQNKNPEELVDKYGTHFINNVLLGHKLTIMYSSETENPDKEDAAILGLSVAMRNIFDIGSGSVKHVNAVLAEGNFSQILSYKAVGGDSTQMLQTEGDEDDFPKVDIQPWLNTLEEENMTFIGKEILPLYELIQDETLKTEVKNYIENLFDT
ncbi:MACPF domain-containing protein [Belliella sp. R4-6]|uniref:MACPF domain-containing protein n=1 Tax=Belliella alkalica TaxID=1730871 RepID=A0ABS9V7M0_9BACT|nr:MAC/perforin domain-containing protein [Belliella alkalica]MCH7412140.1 MACPF domain-containing protein [Belliella alkalica]